MCDKEEGHKGPHQGLFYLWDGDNVKAPKETKQVGDTIFKEYLEQLEWKRKKEAYIKQGKVWKNE